MQFFKKRFFILLINFLGIFACDQADYSDNSLRKSITVLTADNFKVEIPFDLAKNFSVLNSKIKREEFSENSICKIKFNKNVLMDLLSVYKDTFDPRLVFASAVASANFLGIQIRDVPSALKRYIAQDSSVTDEFRGGFLYSVPQRYCLSVDTSPIVINLNQSDKKICKRSQKISAQDFVRLDNYTFILHGSNLIVKDSNDRFSSIDFGKVFGRVLRPELQICPLENGDYKIIVHTYDGWCAIPLSSVLNKSNEGLEVKICICSALPHKYPYGEDNLSCLDNLKKITYPFRNGTITYTLDDEMKIYIGDSNLPLIELEKGLKIIPSAFRFGYIAVLKNFGAYKILFLGLYDSETFNIRWLNKRLDASDILFLSKEYFLVSLDSSSTSASLYKIDNGCVTIVRSYQKEELPLNKFKLVKFEDNVFYCTGIKFNQSEKFYQVFDFRIDLEASLSDDIVVSSSKRLAVNS